MGTLDVASIVFGIVLTFLGIGIAGGLCEVLPPLWRRYRMGPRLRFLRFHRFFYRPAKPAMGWLLVRMSREFYDDLRSLGVSPLALWIEPTGTSLAAFQAELMEDPDCEAECAKLDKQGVDRA